MMRDISSGEYVLFRKPWISILPDQQSMIFRQGRLSPHRLQYEKGTRCPSIGHLVLISSFSAACRITIFLI